MWLGLLVSLWLGNTASAAPTSRHLQTNTPLVPSVYTFEGESLPKVLTLAARTMRICGCEIMVSHFVLERPSDPWFRLSIYLHGPFPTSMVPSLPDYWERARFQGASLPTVLIEAAKYLENCQCQNYVMDMTYERIYLEADSIAPLHVVYVVIGWPFPT
ncbi:MAG TPA: hypothetical protein PLD25_06510 [Chloroflexota bacterium]|nr:hypothetical protein [Chloroflexota bacterium]HUM70292.1 hypothetical protein [Chloroflexota bacterium]